MTNDAVEVIICQLMPVIAEPKAINLEVPKPVWMPGQPCTIPMRTALFRIGSHVAEAYELAANRSEGEEMFLFSAACSIGAEVDSLLVLHRSSGREDSVKVAGYDISPEAIAAARRGKYVVHRLLHESPLQQMAFLEEWGFETSVEAPDSRDLEGRARVIADAAPLRKGHQVEFVEHDLTNPLPDQQPANLILANNLLYHLDAPMAQRIVCNLAEALADNGVIGFGDEIPGRRPDTEAVLREEFDMEPLLQGGVGQAVIYGRRV